MAFLQRLPQPHNHTRRHGVCARHSQHRLSQWQRTVSIVPRAEAADRQPSDIVYSQQQADARNPIKFPCTVPLLPFTVEEVLLPGSIKTLHLFEARYLAMLDTVLAQPGANKVFAHVVVEQQGDAFGDTAAAFPGAYKGEGFVFLMATLVRVVEVKKTFVGALVRVQAESRAEVKEVVQLTPYFAGEVVPLCDEPLQDEQQVSRQVEQLSQTVRDLQNLTQRFKTKQSASLQQAVYWADRAVLIPAVAPAALATDDTVGSTFQQEPAVISAASGSSQSSSSSSSEDSSQTSNLASRSDSSTSSSTSSSSGVADVHVAAAAAAGPASSSEAEAGGSCSDLQRQQQHLAEKAARLSFAALQGVPQESAKDQLKLLRCCVRAMKTTDTSIRLTVVQSHMQNSLNTLAAKCALKALNLG